MNAASVDIKDILASYNSLGLTFKTNLFVAHEPATPDDCVTVYDSSSSMARALDKDNKVYHSSIQIRVRDYNYLEGWEAMNDIREYLDAKVGTKQGGTTYVSIRATSDPQFLMRDENGRFVFFINFEIIRR
jgi:hypothetical protein